MPNLPFQAMILAAGLGTRLKPYTDERPKALVDLNGKPILAYLLDKLKSEGCKRVVINIHYKGSMILDFLQTYHPDGMELVISDETDLLLETGGGLRKACNLFAPDLPVIVHNVDILSDLSFQDLLVSHSQHDSFLTLAVRKRSSSRYLFFDELGLLSGWLNNKTGETLGVVDQLNGSLMAFSGIHVASPLFFKILMEKKEVSRFSIIPLWVEMAKDYPIRFYDHTEGYWSDIGTPEDLESARKNFPF